MSFKKEETFQRRETAILDAATYLFGSRGYDLMTMNDVANAVGIAKPSIQTLQVKRRFGRSGTQ